MLEPRLLGSGLMDKTKVCCLPDFCTKMDSLIFRVQNHFQIFNQNLAVCSEFQIQFHEAMSNLHNIVVLTIFNADMFQG